MVDERQMSFFEEGGMTAPEVEVDAESGNEVPPGSLPEEVRDDVDAKLSSGEYVVPADVLRYYGMKFFEDLRKQAKEELGEMDSEGRIGGEPTMEEGSELSPEEMAMLQEVMSQGQPEFNQGGSVESQSRRLSDIEDIARFRASTEGWKNPEQQKERLKSSYQGEGEGGWLKKKYPFLVQGLMSDKYFSNEPAVIDNKEKNLALDLSLKNNDSTVIENFAAEMRELSDREMEGTASPEELDLLRAYQSFFTGRTGFNQGGMVLRNPELGYAEGGTVESFNPDQWRDVGSSYFGNQQGQQGISVGSYYKTYIGPNGETQLILFVDGKPTTPIPEGFKAREEFVDQAKEEKATEASDRKNDFNDGGESDSRKDEVPANTESWAERNYDALSSDPVAFGLSALDSGFGDKIAANAGRVGMALAGPIGALAGTAIGGGQLINNVASAKAALEIAKAQGQDTGPLETKIKEYEDGLPTRVKQAMDILDAGTGVNYLKDYEAVRNRMNNPLAQTEAVFRSSRSPAQAENRAREIASQYGGGGDSNAEVRTEKAKTTEGTVSTIGGTGEGNAAVSVRSGSAAPTQSSRPQGRPGMAKGGLVKRRKKNTTKT